MPHSLDNYSIIVLKRSCINTHVNKTKFGRNNQQHHTDSNMRTITTVKTVITTNDIMKRQDLCTFAVTFKSWGSASQKTGPERSLNSNIGGYWQMSFQKTSLAWVVMLLVYIDNGIMRWYINITVSNIVRSGLCICKAKNTHELIAL